MSELITKVDKTLRHHAKRLSSSVRRMAWAGQPLRRPIFVVGCSRAGTTLVYKTLSVSAELGSLNRETHDFWSELNPLESRGWVSHCLHEAADREGHRNHVARFFFEHLGRRRVVDKCNQNGLAIPYLFSLFPDAMFVFVKRSPGDNILSLMEGWRRPDEYATWSKGLPGEVRIESGQFRDWCFFLPEGWREYLSASLAEVCAYQYASMNEAILRAGEAIPAHQWHEVCYESALRDPTTEFRRMFDACDLDFTDVLELHCRTVIERPYNAFSPIKEDKWKDSDDAAVIAPHLPSLESLSQRLGYD
ncbi:MAG: sulfotransferase [Pseudomonadota bacterium]